MQDEDVFDFGAEEEAPQEQDSNPVKQLRTHADKLEKQLKKANAENEELRQFKDEFNNKQRAEKVSAVFTELGLNPTHARFWQLENPETEPDATTVGKWAVDNGFAQATEETPTTGGFTPTTTPEGIAPSGKRFTLDEWLNISASNPDEGARILAQGSVDRTDLRVGLGPER